MTAGSNRKANSVETVCEPGVSAEWVLEVSSFAGAEPTAAATSSRSCLATTLEVEQAIAACIVEHADIVARWTPLHQLCGTPAWPNSGCCGLIRWKLDWYKPAP
jgi:hypothetical protein